MEENRTKITWRNLLPELICFILAAGGILGISLLRQKTTDVLLSNLVLGVAGVAILGYCVRQAYLEGQLDYDNGKHYRRFWLCFLVGLAGAFVCTFLPVGAWPYLSIFVMLALFGNMGVGILAGAVLLVISVMLSEATPALFALYFLNGAFGIALFQNLDRDFRIGIRMFLSLFCLLLCEMAGILLLANERPSVESFVIPVANIIISGILLIGILKFFSSQVVFKYREKYLELNDTENPLLAECKSHSKEEYMHSVHTAYFCERIAGKLSLDVDALKCAGYYHRLCGNNPQLMEEQQFPPKACEIMKEFFDKKKPIRHKETAVLMCADYVMNTVQQLVEKSKGHGLNYDYIIDGVFKHFTETEVFAKCDISMREYKMMWDIFKEEKLYYDFLR